MRRTWRFHLSPNHRTRHHRRVPAVASPRLKSMSHRNNCSERRRGWATLYSGQRPLDRRSHGGHRAEKEESLSVQRRLPELIARHVESCHAGRRSHDPPPPTLKKDQLGFAPSSPAAGDLHSEWVDGCWWVWVWVGVGGGGNRVGSRLASGSCDAPAANSTRGRPFGIEPTRRTIGRPESPAPVEAARIGPFPGALSGMSLPEDGCRGRAGLRKANRLTTAPGPEPSSRPVSMPISRRGPPVTADLRR